MSMSFGLATSLSTSQKLTPQMQQAIKLLQLSSLELAQEVQTKLDSNPLLERIEDDEEDGDEPDKNSAELAQQTPEPLTLEIWNSATPLDANDATDYGTADHEFVDDISGYDDVFNVSFDSASFDSANFENSRFDSGSYGSAAISYDDLDSYQGSTSATIQDHVRWQLNFKHLSAIDMLIADYLIDSMNDIGFVQLDMTELLQSFATMASFYQWDTQVEADEIETVLHIIQSCAPLGVGARNLSECLNIQLAKLAPTTQYLAQAQALLSASEHLVSNNIKALTAASGLSAEQITPALTLLRTLNPAPGLAFQSQQPDYNQPPASYDIPDVLVTPVKRSQTATHMRSESAVAGWQVALNPETLPKLRVNQQYASLVKRGDVSPDNQCLRDNLVDARLFIRSIEERNQNLLKVANSIVRRQQAFLLQGAAAMQPLILKDIAEEVGLHESTISRLTTSKTILTPQGLFALKYFFSSHVSSNAGDISSTAISAMIKQLINDENCKKPLSDSRLQAQLHAGGIDIARRTVAKYREAMHISSSTQRKQKY
jgi:RNA polymerase sigma-54 factor